VRTHFIHVVIGSALTTACKRPANSLRTACFKTWLEANGCVNTAALLLRAVYQISRRRDDESVLATIDGRLLLAGPSSPNPPTRARLPRQPVTLTLPVTMQDREHLHGK
jgi:hypothetical protein